MNPIQTSHTLTRTLAPLVVAVVLLAGCGSSDETPSTSPATDAPIAGVDTGPDAEPPVDESTVTSDDVPPSDDVDPDADDPGADTPDADADASVEGLPEDESVDDQVDAGIDDLDPDVVEEIDPFVPAAGDAAFCAANEAFENEMQPENEDEVARAAQTFIAELLAVAPDDIRADLELFEVFLAGVVSGETSFDAADSDPGLTAAGDRIGDFIEERCEGNSPRPDPVAVPDSDVDPDLPDGLIIPVVPIDGEIRETNTPYFGAEGDDGGAADPQPGFDRESRDVGFCTAVDIINRRPQPRDDFEEIIVGQQYLVAIEPLVPDELRASYGVLLDWVDTLVENGSLDGIEEPDNGSELDAAVDAVDSFVDERCLGLPPG